MELGRVGIWAGGPWRDAARLAEARDAAAEVEALGYSALWRSGGFVPGVDEAFGRLLSATSRMVVASGILTVWHATPAQAAAAFIEFEREQPGRFLLGLGASHAHLVERLGESYVRPYSRVTSFLDDLDAIEPGVPRERRVLAALGPRMLALARDRAAGAHPYFVPVEHTARARQILGPGPLLAPEQAVVLETDPARARAIARRHTHVYLRAPNYVRNLRSLGFGEDDLAGDGSDRLVDAVVAWGDAEEVAARVGAHFEAGADHVCVQVLAEDADAFPLPGYRELAPALIG